MLPAIRARYPEVRVVLAFDNQPVGLLAGEVDLAIRIARLRYSHASDAIADGSLVRLLPDDECETVDAHALYPRHRRLSARVRVFVDEDPLRCRRTGTRTTVRGRARCCC
jgi:DNA-binding transcriptional LysR family regulator